MKRVWAIFLLMLVLAGCTKPQDTLGPGIGGESIQGDEGIQDQVQTDTPFRQWALPMGEEGNLWQMSGDIIADMTYPSLYMFSGDLLLSEYDFSDSMDSSVVTLKLLDLEEGTLLGQRKLNCGQVIRIQTCGDRIGLCDPGSGRVLILDQQLETVKEYRMEITWDEWVLSADLSKLYVFDGDTGIRCVDLESRRETLILRAWSAGTMVMGNGEITVSYVDCQAQKCHTGVLDLRTGVLRELPWEEAENWTCKAGDTLLMGDSQDYGKYHLFTEELHYTVRYSGMRMELIPETGELYTLDAEGRNPCLYSRDGTFLSAAKFLAGEWLQMNGNPAWCPDWGGYFLVTVRDDKTSQLLFWDTRAEVSGTDLDLEVYQEDPVLPHTAEESLYRRAEELSRLFGVDIRIAEQCGLDYNEFTAQMVTDTDTLNTALDTLEEALYSYPAGFFEQLCYGRIDSIRIELVCGLKRKDWPEDAVYSSFAAFAQETTDHYLLVMDVYHTARTYYHEFSHIIDRRLEWDAGLRKEAVYSGIGWAALQPEGFVYSYHYEAPPENWPDYLNWFVDDYAMTYPTEDRARIMEYAMMGWDWHFTDRQALIPKLAYYTACIRDCFDTTGWPELTKWEETLMRAAPELLAA